ncbi:DUF6479 family protein [Streptomyces sp. NBC_00670]|jgi:hypothetical protein|uniref:DUF6479 family protein n=1 Tax=Streptomyces sp. NBC_00670 TaxID=2975804 RepID=UPI002E311E4C|nr:DUF6479 family protein [Streptomyces sp. NBC_00670]
MGTENILLLAASSHAFNLVGAFVGGLVIAGLLIWAVTFGITVRTREPGPPRPDEQPHLPDGGAIREESEMREADEVHQCGEGEDRLLPHDMHRASTRHAEDQHRRRWDPGSSGSFGSGGLGHV